jgi:hypothetical protein
MENLFLATVDNAIAQGQGHFTALQDLNTCNHIFDLILKEKQMTNVLLAHWNIIAIK